MSVAIIHHSTTEPHRASIVLLMSTLEPTIFLNNNIVNRNGTRSQTKGCFVVIHPLTSTVQIIYAIWPYSDRDLWK